MYAIRSYYVSMNELIGKADDTGLSANIHCGISGKVVEVTPAGIKIRRAKEA